MTEAECRGFAKDIELTGQFNWYQLSDGDTTRNCFVRDILTKALGRRILKLGETYPVACNFRERFLVSSPVGKRMLTQYYKNLDKVFVLVEREPELIVISLKAWAAIWPFVLGMLHVERMKDLKQDGKRPQMRLSKKQLESILQLVKRFRAASTDGNFKDALDEFEIEARNYVGLTPAEAIKILRRKPTKAKRIKKTKCG